MQNKKFIFIGISISLFFVFFLNGFFQYILFLLFGANVEGVHFLISGLTPALILNPNSNIYLNSFFLLLQIVINLFFIEISFALLKATKLGFIKYSTIIFIIIISGDLIISIFYGLIELILSPKNNSLWGRLVQLWNFEGNQIFAFVFFVIVILFAYFQMVQKRLMQYLVIKKIA